MNPERWFYTVPLRIRSLFRHDRVEADLDDELRDHIERQTAQYVAQGMDPRLAHAAALRNFGPLEGHKEDARDARGVASIEHVLQDLSFAARVLRKSPGFTTVAVLTLALGIGANTAILSLVQSIMLRSVPYANPDRLVAIYETDTHGSLVGISKLDFQDWRRQTHSFAHLAAAGRFGARITRGSTSSFAQSAQVSPELFDVLGVKPISGNVFTTTGQSVVISEGYWRRELGGADVVGQTLVVDDTGRVITGIMPAQFDYPHGVDLWIPQDMLPRVKVARTIRFWSLVGDLRPGVTIASAQQELSGIAARLGAAYPATNAGVGAKVMSLQESLIGNVRPTLLLLTAIAALVLLLACANLANLMLVRGASRRREMAVRTALGATRSRLRRQLLTEALMLSAGGALLGLPLAVWASAGLRSLPQAKSLPFAVHQSSVAVLLFEAAITILTTVVFGMVPAVRAARVDVVTSLKEAGGRGMTSLGLSGGLVAGEIALATILCVGAALTGRSLSRLEGESLGFDPDGVVVLSATSGTRLRGDALAAMNKKLLESIRQSTGTASASFVDNPPFGGYAVSSAIVEGEPSGDRAHWHQAMSRTISNDYFRTLEIPLKRGRDFVPADGHAELLAIVNESFARNYLSWRDPIGAHVALPEADSITWAAYQRGQPIWSTVIGVVGDIREADLGTPPRPTVYFASIQHPEWPFGSIIARTNQSTTTAADAITRIAKSIDPGMSPRVVALRDSMLESVLAPRLRALVVAAFAALALILASIGVYGVTAHVTAQRTAEIGIRIALGARPMQVITAVAGRIALYALAGLTLGIVVSLLAARLIRALLYGIGPADFAAFAAAGLVAAVIAAVATFIPAGRATRIDPTEALRAE